METTQTSSAGRGEAEIPGLAAANEEKMKRARKRSRTSVLAKVGEHPSSKDGSSSSVGRKLSSAGPAIAAPDGSSGKSVKNDGKSAKKDGDAGQIGNVHADAAAIEAGRRREIVAFDDTAGRDSKKKKKKTGETGPAQHFESPAAVILDFTQETIAAPDGSSAKSVKKDGNAGHIGSVHADAAAIEAGQKRKKVSFDAAIEAGHKRKKVAFDATTDSDPKKKKTGEETVPAQHFENPAALILDFTQETIDPPSKEELLSTFRKFGLLLESRTNIARDKRRARIVFGRSAEAEAAYSCAETLGRFGPPFATLQLQPLPPIKLRGPRLPSPAPKLPLTDMRKNLEQMISSLTFHSALRKDGVHDLLGEMQGLLAKVDKKLNGGPSTTTAHHH